MREVSSSDKSQSAKLNVIDKIDSAKGCCLKIELITGVRHQIRSQLEGLGFPILGDDLYGGRVYSRLMLHAYKYEFSFHDNGDYTIEAPTPDLFDDFLDLDGGA